ncbi:MAG: AzlC family ABC transporter permease, partial [Longicatena sp.]
MKMSERAIIAYGITDEIFALASSTYERVGKMYMFGLIAFPLFCWTFGTFLGGAASNILPTVIRESLGIAIYGMFLAIIIPPAKKLSSVRKVLIIAIIMSCVFAIIYPYIPVSSGFVIIICTVVASALGAYFFPIEEVTHHE